MRERRENHGVPQSSRASGGRLGGVTLRATDGYVARMDPIVGFLAVVAILAGVWWAAYTS